MSGWVGRSRSPVGWGLGVGSEVGGCKNLQEDFCRGLWVRVGRVPVGRPPNDAVPRTMPSPEAVPPPEAVPRPQAVFPGPELGGSRVGWVSGPVDEFEAASMKIVEVGSMRAKVYNGCTGAVPL